MDKAGRGMFMGVSVGPDVGCTCARSCCCGSGVPEFGGVKNGVAALDVSTNVTLERSRAFCRGVVLARSEMNAYMIYRNSKRVDTHRFQNNLRTPSRVVPIPEFYTHAQE